MIEFGKYAILQPIEYHFKLEPEWVWKIRPPTSGDELEMARFMNRGKLVASMEGTSREAPPTWLEIAHREIAITFAGTNIMNGDRALLRDNASVAEVEAVLRTMPQAMVTEIWTALGEAVPGWGKAPLPNPQDPAS